MGGVERGTPADCRRSSFDEKDFPFANEPVVFMKGEPVATSVWKEMQRREKNIGKKTAPPASTPNSDYPADAADQNERAAIILQIDSFLPVTNGDEKSFRLKFREKLERLFEKFQ